MIKKKRVCHSDVKCHTTCTSWLMLPLKGPCSILSRNILRTKLNFYQILPFLVTFYLDQYPRKLNAENKSEGVVLLEGWFYWRLYGS